MSKYRKKPVVIEAVLYDQYAHEYFWFTEDGWGGAPEWLQAAAEKPCDTDGAFSLYPDEDGETTFLSTLGGRRTVSIGDWIIQAVNGELYTCNPEIFDLEYEAVG